MKKTNSLRLSTMFLRDLTGDKTATYKPCVACSAHIFFRFFNKDFCYAVFLFFTD